MTSAAVPSAPEAFPDDSTPFSLPGPAGVLEVLAEPPEPDKRRPAVVIVCHPLPTHGGTLRNKVVHMTARALRELGLYTVRFNFRGVGASEGEFDNGFGETDDLLAVVDWVQRVLPDCELWLAGFSFGSYVAARASQKVKVRQLISIAPPVHHYDFEALERPDCPWLIIQGDEDDVVPPDEVYKWAEAIEPEPQLVRMEETDHFFHRRLMDLRGVIKNGVRHQLPETSGA
jgi:alpha/beta superfamily hydrolase